MGVIARQSIKGTVMNYIGVAVGLFTTFFILTKYLSEEEVGLTKVLIDSAVMLSTLAQLGTNTSAMRYYPHFKDEGNRDNGFFGWTVILPFIGFLIFGTLAVVFKQSVIGLFADKSSLFVKYYYFVLPLAFSMLYLSVFETNANLLMRIVVPRFVREVGVRLMTLALYLLFGFRVISLDGLVIGLCLTYLVAALLNVFYLLSLKRISFRVKPKFVSFSLRRDFLFYTLFMVASSLTTVIAPFMNTYFISVKMGLFFTGLYTIAQDMANLVEMPYRSLGAITRPGISQAFKDDDMPMARFLTKSVSLHQFVVGALIFFAIWINIDLVYSMLPNGESYAAAKWMFLILAITKLFNSSLSIGGTVLSYSKHYYWSLLFTVVLAFFVIFLNIKFIPLWGMEGAALASLGAYFIYYLLMLAFVQWKTKVNPFSTKQIVMLLITLALFGLNWMWARWIAPSIDSMFGGAILFNNATWGAAIDGLLKTCIMLAIAMVAIYRFNVSKQMNELIDRVLHRNKAR